MDTKWTKRIRVDKDIVALLSRRTYDSFPQAIREVVSNAYDADSTLVEIEIDRASDEIRIKDNGCGMTPEDFDYYLRIAAMRREARMTSRLGRRRIGYFGIGFLSMFPFCRSIEITSTTENSDVVLDARINAQAYIAPSSSKVDVGDIEVHGVERRDPTFRRAHGTTFTLSGLTDLVTQYFDIRPDTSRRSIQSWHWRDRLRWEMEQILPLEYRRESPLAGMFDTELDTPMEVRLDGVKLYRNDVRGAEVLEASREPVEERGVRFMYSIVTPRTTVAPVEARGLQLRLRNVGVGNPTYFGLNIVGRIYGKLVWLAGEVHILDGLDEDVSMDRNTFTWSPRYEALSEYFVEKLRNWAERLDVEHGARRDIDDFIEGNMGRAPAIPRREAIEDRIGRLKRLGYEVVEIDEPTVHSSRPVEIDHVDRTVNYFVNHPELDDVIVVAGTQYRVQFKRWDYRHSKTPACEIEGDCVVFNQNYPLFQDHHTKRICQKVAMLLEIGRRQCANRTELSCFVLQHLPEEIAID